MASEAEALVQLLQGAQARFQAALQGISEAELRTPPREGEWTVAQVVGHVAELQPFWMRKVLLMVTLENPSVARTPEEQEQRVRAVAEAEGMPWPELERRLQESAAQALELARRLRDGDLRRLGTRGDGQAVTVQQMVERFIAGHLEEHARQVEATRRAVAAR